MSSQAPPYGPRTGRDGTRTMLAALGLNLLLGMLFSSTGMLMAHVAKSGRSVFAFYAVANLFVAVGAAAFLVDWSAVPAKPTGDLTLLIVVMAGGAACNAMGVSVMVHAMRYGHKALSWAICQSAMGLSFLAGVILFGDQITWLGAMGLVVMLGSLALAAQSARDNQQRMVAEAEGAAMSAAPNVNDAKVTKQIEQQKAHAARNFVIWLILTLGGFLLLGSAQTLFSVPSRWESADPAMLRPLIVMVTGFSCQTAMAGFTGGRVDRFLIKWGLIMGVILLATYTTLFKTMDLMGDMKLAGLVFPTAVGTTLVIFPLYSRWRLGEPLTPRTLGAIALAMVALAMLGLEVTVMR